MRVVEYMEGPRTMASVAKALGISTRRLRTLCAQDRILGAQKDPVGGQWDVSRAYGVLPAKRGPQLRHLRNSPPHLALVK